MGSRNLEADLFFNQLQKAQTADAQFKPFFIEIQNFWAWADKFGQINAGGFGVFSSLVHVFH